MCCITLTLLNCVPVNTEENNTAYLSDSEEVMPEDVWISDAERWLNVDVKKNTHYTLYASIFDTKREAEMHFDSDRRLFLIRILKDPGFRHDLYCEEGRVVFSEHWDQANNKDWIMAYANGKAYAAALRSGESWKGILPGEVLLRPQLLDSALKLGVSYQKKETTKPLPTRILENQSEIVGAFKDKISIPFVINVRKGDYVSILVEDETDNAYFTIDTGKGFTMEHQRWEGIAEKTGDIAITVFSVEPKADRKFRLTTETTLQNQDYAQAE